MKDFSDGDRSPPTPPVLAKGFTHLDQTKQPTKVMMLLEQLSNKQTIAKKRCSISEGLQDVTVTAPAKFQHGLLQPPSL